MVAQNKPNTVSFLNVSLRSTKLDLGGVLRGHWIEARPPAGYELLVFRDHVRRGDMAAAVMYILLQTISAWDLKDDSGRTLELSDETLQLLSAPALNALQDAIEPLREAIDQEAAAFFGAASETSPEDTPSS